MYFGLQYKKSKDEKGDKKMLERVKEIVVDTLGVDAEEVTETASFTKDLGADSLDLFELVMALEDEYETKIPTEDLEQIQTVADVITYLNK